MKRILIYGAAGAGKTMLSRLLHKERGIPLREGDYLREVIAAKRESAKENPFLHLGTKQVWRRF